MTRKELHERLNHEPLEPFWINPSDGKPFDVRDPRPAAAMETRLFIALPQDHWARIALRQVRSIQSVKAV
jgi:hypothetical protein